MSIRFHNPVILPQQLFTAVPGYLTKLVINISYSAFYIRDTDNSVLIKRIFLKIEIPHRLL
ncbi:MAG: hypothetical protein OI74_09860 [Gammaproteobacteria bacterium (ex Lamellibrachia satsuma)]|nr:MAG: hypothetical protein OI74_09860 [Gammaproteobacteria bacterium (ex Lamellibrachia satsuma)]RRS37633.1 MAG: hypothetical protein NV67_00060 [Gammaproteobacteria bacterium (ex Lamellibrachia satsuma)]